VALLDAVLGEKVSPVTKALLEQTVRTSRDHNLDLAAEELSELAAARRDRYVAHVGTPVALTAAQEQQLTDTLSRLYGRQMSLQIELNPELLGGLVVRVGGEVIDGSVSSRLSAAKRALPK
jgi:F-type H+-transporting ATPase subunit delta